MKATGRTPVAVRRGRAKPLEGPARVYAEQARELSAQMFWALDRLLELLLGKTTSSPCTGCQSRPTCKEPCEALLHHLPGATAGRGHSENLTEAHIETLDARERTRRSDVFAQYEACQDIFTPKQWQAVCLHYKEGKSLAEIAGLLSKSRSTVSDLLTRARERKEACEKKRREEFFRLNQAEDRN